MSQSTDAATPEDKPDFKISIQVTEAANGDLGFQVMGQAVRLVDVRKHLEWALNRINDEIHAEMTRNIIQQELDKKTKQNGFRKINLRAILGR